MRFLTVAEIFFGISIFFLLFSFKACGYEFFHKKDFCTVELSRVNKGECIIPSNKISSFRVVVRFGGDEKTIREKIPLYLQVKAKRHKDGFYELMPKSTSAINDGYRNKRYHKTLNYGKLEIPISKHIEIFIKADDGVRELSIFKVRFLENPNNFYIYLFSIFFLFSLFFSIYFRKKIFLNKYTKFIPYLLFFFVTVLTLTWNI